MAHSYDDEKRLLELQAKTGRLSKSAAQRQLQILMEDRVEYLEKQADIFHYQPGMSMAYRAMAKEVRDSIPTTLEKVAGTSEERASLQKVATADRERSVVATTYATSPDARPIGMPAPATATPTGPTISRGPDNGPVWPSKPESQMTNEQRAAYYTRLVRAAPTLADARYCSELATNCTEAAREERS